MEPLQYPEQGRGDDGQPAVIDHEIQSRCDGLQIVLFLRPHVQIGAHGAGLPRRNFGHGQDDACGIEIAANLAREVFAFSTLFGQNRADEIVLHHGDPAIVGLAWNLGVAVGDVVKIDLLELVGIGKEGGAGKGVHAHCLDALCCVAVALQLEVGIGAQRRRAVVGNLVAHVDDVAAAREGEYLGHRNAIDLRCFEPQRQRVLALCKRLIARRQFIVRLVIRQAAAGQAALCRVEVCAAIVQQYEVLALVFGCLVMGQLDMNDVATIGRDVGDEHVGTHLHRRRGARRLVATWHIAIAGTYRGGRLWNAGITVGGRCGLRGDRRRGRRVVLHPAVPQHVQGKAENQGKDETSIVHQGRHRI